MSNGQKQPQSVDPFKHDDSPNVGAKSLRQPKVNRLSQHYRTVGRIRHNSPQPESGELVPGVRRHARYLSDFSDNLIRLDVSHHQNDKQSAVETIDIEKQLVACVRKGSLYQTPKPLVDFPDVIIVFKIALNRTLFKNHNGAIAVGVNECKRTFLRIFAWMCKRNIFHFSDLTKESISTLVDEVALHGWAATLEQEKNLNDVLKQARADGEIFKRLYNRCRNGKNFSIPISTLEDITGLPLHQQSISSSFYHSLAKIENDTRTITKKDIGKNEREYDAVRTLIHTLNALSVSSEKSIPFFPFPKAYQAILQAIEKAEKIKKIKKETASQTSETQSSLLDSSSAPNPTTNLTIAECAAIFTEALRWLYDYSPTIISTLEYAREKMRFCADNYEPIKKTWAEIIKFYETKAKAAEIPISTINGPHTGENSLRFVCQLTQKACLDIMGICGARRLNEIIGSGQVPYGLYLGALIKLNELPPVWSIDSYVSKGPQDWFSFPANKLMVDAYELLGKLHTLHMPYSWKPLDELAPIKDKRKQKLFPLGKIHPGPLKSKIAKTYFSSVGRRKFLELAGVDPTRFENTMTPYRRLFCTLHMNRYDMPEEPALQHYLGQLSPNSAYGYFVDRSKRPAGESIRELHAPTFVDKDFLAELEFSRIEYAAANIKKMLEGQPVGGGFPVVVAKLAKKLSAQVSFATLSTELKANHLSRKLYDHGYRADPKEHTCCMGGAPKKSDETANCFRNGSLHKEEASTQRCKGCINSSTNTNSVMNVQREITESTQAISDTKLPPSLRRAHRSRADQLTEALAEEEEIAGRNLQLFRQVEDAWLATVALHVKDAPAN